MTMGLARFAPQKGKVLQSIVVFAGAGASYGVGHDKYPMAKQFHDTLPEQIRIQQLFSTVCSFIHAQLRAKQPDVEPVLDIELVLWELGQLVEACSAWTTQDKFASQLMATNQLGGLVGSNLGVSPTHQLLGQLQAHTTELMKQINAQVYKLYGAPPTRAELENSWLPLLEWIKTQQFERIDLVTTNYDLVIEEALEKSVDMNVDAAHTQGLRPSLDLSKWSSKGPTGLLTKLHGSVDWVRSGAGDELVIRRGHFDFPGNHDDRSILYPGFKGVPSSEPFTRFHRYFADRLAEASHVLVIGFAFRDEHINDLFRARLHPHAKVAIVNPGELGTLPFSQKATHFDVNFGGPSPTTKPGKNPVFRLSMSDLSNWMKA